MSLKKNILILFGIVLVSLIIVIFILDIPSYTITELHSKTYNETLYIKKTSYSSMSDFNISISQSQNLSKSLDKLNDIIIGGDQLFFKYNNDTLNIYTTRKCELPENFKSNITIIQNVLTMEEIKNLEIEYKKGIRLFN